MARTTRLAHLHAVEGAGIRIGAPNGPHLLLTPAGMRAHRVKDTASGAIRQEDVPWRRVRALRTNIPVKESKTWGQRVFGWVGALVTSDLPTGESAMKSVDVEMTVALSDADARPATWRFRVLTMKVGAFRPEEAAAAEELLARIVAEPALQERLDEPVALLEEHRAA